MMVRNHRAAADRGMALNNGLIITGASSLPGNVVRALDTCGVPTLAVHAVGNSTNMLSFKVLTSISDFTRKMDASDSKRLAEAIAHVQRYTALDALVDGATPEWSSSGEVQQSPVVSAAVTAAPASRIELGAAEWSPTPIPESIRRKAVQGL